MSQIKYIVGIDEAGRGPLAGPVALGAFLIENKKINSTKLKKMFKGARDSKKMTEKKRGEIFEKINEKINEEIKKYNSKPKNSHPLRYIVGFGSAKIIDKKGISWAIKNCIKKCLIKLVVTPKDTLVLLDGGIKAPAEFVHQKTIIGGDDKEIVISLASICAKVSRDARMIKLSKKYPLYGLEKHKGYGTVSHRKAIKKHGPSLLHRRTFLDKIKY
jgi:ribonuclease HII